MKIAFYTLWGIVYLYNYTYCAYSKDIWVNIFSFGVFNAIYLITLSTYILKYSSSYRTCQGFVYFIERWVYVMFYNQLERLCQQNNIAMTTVVQKLGMSKSVVTSWKKGIIPTGETILKLAQYFNVSTDFLLTGSLNTTDLYDKEIELLQMFRSLPNYSQERVLGYIEGCLETIKEKAPD